MPISSPDHCKIINFQHEILSALNSGADIIFDSEETKDRLDVEARFLGYKLIAFGPDLVFENGKMQYLYRLKNKIK